MSPLLIDHNSAYIVVVVDSYFGLSTLHAAQLTTKSNSERTWNNCGIFGWPTLLYNEGAKSFDLKND